MTNIPQPPISSPLNILRTTGGGGRRRWRDDSWSLHAIVGEVLHLDCLSDEQLGLPPLLVLDGLVDVHYLFTNVFVHFGQSLRNLCTVGCLLRHSVVETLWGRSECEQSDYIKLKISDLIFVWCVMNIIQWLKGCIKKENKFSVPDIFQHVSAYKRPMRTRIHLFHNLDFIGLNQEFILPLTIFSLLGDSGGLGRASFFFLVATPVTLRFLRVSVPQIITARFFVNLESPWVRCSWCHFSSSTQIPPPRCTCREDERKTENHILKSASTVCCR